MENSGPLILDISSDEEAGFGDVRRRGGNDIGRGEFTEEDCRWLTRLLDEVDGHNDDDSDEVVVVSEVFPKHPRKSRLESIKPSARVDAESNNDDDCVVLDGDPDKAVAAMNVRSENNGDRRNDSDNDSDDLEIVGEKGEVACRDFPHARHLCAKFGFASTPHEFHCSQCHCYVCDSLAPCSHWGTGISTVDHCHANDKEDYWRAERKRMKNGGTLMPVNPVPISMPTTIDTSLLEAIFESPQVPDLPQHNSFLQNQGLGPFQIPSCSLSSSASVPPAVSQGRIRPLGHTPMHKPRSEPLSLQSQPAYNNSVPSRDESNNVRSGSAQSFTPHVVMKRSGLAFPSNRHVSGSRLHRNSLVRRYHPVQPPLTDGCRGSDTLNTGSNTTPVLPQPLPSLPGMAVGCTNYLPPQPQPPMRPFSACSIRDPVLLQSQVSTQPYLNSDFGSVMHLQCKPPSQLGLEHLENLICPQTLDDIQPSSPLPSQTLVSHRSDGDTAFGDHLHSRSMISSCSNEGNNFESQSSGPQPRFNPTTLSIDDQRDIQHANCTHNGLDASSTDFGINWDSSFSSGNQEIELEVSHRQVAASADSSQLQYSTKGDNHQLVAAVENSHPSGVVLANTSSQINGTDCHFPESTISDQNFHLDNWMFENDSFPGAFEVPISPGWNEFSADPASIGIDTGTLFDI